MYIETFKIVIRMIAIISLYYVLDYFFESTIIIILVVVAAAFFISYNSIFKNDFDYRFKTSCDANSYLDKINKRKSRKKEYIYNTYLAFAYVYIGNYADAKKSIVLVDKELLSNKQDLIDKYYGSKLKIAFSDDDLESYTRILEELEKIYVGENSEVTFEFFEVPKLILEKNYSEAQKKLLELIPHQKRRIYVYELEYYLALAHIGLGNKEDALAVLEFVSSKRFKLIYIEKCKELLESI